MSHSDNSEKLNIINMAIEKKVTPEEALGLLDALNKRTAAPKLTKKFLKVLVDSKEAKVDVKVPLALISAGINVGSFLPDKVRQNIEGKMQGFDMGQMSEELVVALQDLEVNVDAPEAKVKVFCE